MSKVKIYQIKDIANTTYAFRDYYEQFFNIADYELKAERVFDTTGMESIEDLLEYIFEAGNDETGFKNQYDMRSVSVSDVIDVDGKKFYVNGMGFVELA